MGLNRAGKCPLCGAFRESLHRDHIIPRFKGGTDDATNIQLICANCHEDKTLADWMAPENAEARAAAYKKQKGRFSEVPLPPAEGGEV